MGVVTKVVVEPVLIPAPAPDQTPPVVSLDPVTQAIDEGTNLTLTAEASPKTGQRWYKNGVATEVTTTDYVITNAMASDAADYYCQFTNNGVSTPSAVATLTVNQASPSVTLEPQSGTHTEGDSVTLTADATGAFYQQWFKDGQPTANLNKSLVLDPIALSDDAVYFCRFYNENLSLYDDTQPATITVSALVQYGELSITSSTSPDLADGAIYTLTMDRANGADTDVTASFVVTGLVTSPQNGQLVWTDTNDGTRQANITMPDLSGAGGSGTITITRDNANVAFDPPTAIAITVEEITYPSGRFTIADALNGIPAEVSSAIVEPIEAGSLTALSARRDISAGGSTAISDNEHVRFLSGTHNNVTITADNVLIELADGAYVPVLNFQLNDICTIRCENDRQGHIEVLGPISRPATLPSNIIVDGISYGGSSTDKCNFEWDRGAMINSVFRGPKSGGYGSQANDFIFANNDVDTSGGDEFTCRFMGLDRAVFRFNRIKNGGTRHALRYHGSDAGGADLVYSADNQLEGTAAMQISPRNSSATIYPNEMNRIWHENNRHYEGTSLAVVTYGKYAYSSPDAVEPPQPPVGQPDVGAKPGALIGVRVYCRNNIDYAGRTWPTATDWPEFATLPAAWDISGNSSVGGSTPAPAWDHETWKQYA